MTRINLKQCNGISVFNTSDYKDDWGADDSEVDPPTCAYRGYRNPPDHAEPYGLSPHYWHVFAARLAFVVVFEVSFNSSFDSAAPRFTVGR